jgi:predicted O-methyltransferase YrrM
MAVDYPSVLAVHGPNLVTVDWVKRTKSKNVGELGIYRGYTSVEIAKVLPASGSLDLFDYADVVKPVVDKITKLTRVKIRGFGNSRKTMDSYVWSLAKLLQSDAKPRWDYVFIDGAHTLQVDGLAFVFVDKLLRPGGYVDFDDHAWSFKVSPTLNPTVFPQTKEHYTDEQIRTSHVAMVLELLVRRAGYKEVLKNKLFQKPR